MELRARMTAFHAAPPSEVQIPLHVFHSSILCSMDNSIHKKAGARLLRQSVTSQTAASRICSTLSFSGRGSLVEKISLTALFALLFFLSTVVQAQQADTTDQGDEPNIEIVLVTGCEVTR